MLEQYIKQKHRGQEGFGLFDGQKLNIVRATKENKIIKWLTRYNSDLLLFHHRFPTSTVNVKRAAHPFGTKQYFGDTQYVLVHNGVIRNADELFVDHQELGIEYSTLLQDMTFNDSEALLWDFALFMEGKQPAMKTMGDAAFICIKLKHNKLERLYFYRNTGRPLNMLRTKDSITLSSEGEGEPIPIDTLFNWNYQAKRLTKRKLLVQERKYTPLPAYRAYTPSTNFARQSYSGDYQDAYGPYTPGSYADNYQDDETAYQNWWEGKDAQTAGNWLGDHLRHKYDHFFAKDGSVKQNVLDFEESHNGVFVPKTKKHERELVQRNQDYPTADEIQTEAMAYLAGVQGHFEQAYWAIELDYEDLEEVPQTKSVIRQKVLLDLALQMLDNDPEYENEESVSSMWRAIWANQVS